MVMVIENADQMHEALAQSGAYTYEGFEQVALRYDPVKRRLYRASPFGGQAHKSLSDVMRLEKPSWGLKWEVVFW